MDFQTAEGEETSFCERGRGALDQGRGKRRWDVGVRWAGEDAAIESSGSSSMESPLSAVEAVRRGRPAAVWSSSRLSAWVAMPSSLKEVKLVMAERTGSGRRRNQRPRRTSI